MMPTTGVRVSHRVGRRSLRRLVEQRRIRQGSATTVRRAGDAALVPPNPDGEQIPPHRTMQVD